jgi:hypothetical protein
MQVYDRMTNDKESAVDLGCCLLQWLARHVGTKTLYLAFSSKPRG